MLAGLYPVIFFLGNNWYIYSASQEIVLVIFAPVLCSILLVSVSELILRIVKIFHGLFRRSQISDIAQSRLNDFVVSALSIAVCAFLIRNAVVGLKLPAAILVSLVALTMLIGGGVAALAGARRLISVFGFLVIVGTLNLFYNVYFTEESGVLDWASRNKAVNDQTKFSKFPNVYLILAESYPNREALEMIYKVDNSSFYTRMADLGFRLQHRYYSNYNHTLASLPSMFVMQHHYYEINIGNFDSIGGRSILEGKSYNPVLDIFQRNGYKIQYIHSTDSLISKGATVDYSFPEAPMYLALEVFLTHQDTTKMSLLDSRGEEFMEVLDRRLLNTAKGEDRYFTFVYTTQPGHSPSRLTSTNRGEINRVLEEFRKNHGSTIEAANRQLLEIVQLIIANDPDPLIVVAGDHGPWGYRLKQDGEGRVISDGLFALDRFGVLMAYHFPKDYDRRFDISIRTHVNLFRYIFSYLADDYGILAKKQPDNSYDFDSFMAIRDGYILNGYEKFFPPPKM